MQIRRNQICKARCQDSSKVSSIGNPRTYLYQGSAVFGTQGKEQMEIAISNHEDKRSIIRHEFVPYFPQSAEGVFSFLYSYSFLHTIACEFLLGQFVVHGDVKQLVCFSMDVIGTNAGAGS
jgi:hypothetical protein